ncbi:uncharacterized protein [Rutidosis leptorrhynchoides]|uniref:uncharacterized protein n=1 Tax=Rutidosis leptorrhynchoides TaxID=125765 RepID=UPI003A991212
MKKELKIASWNIRGMNTLDKQSEVNDLIKDEDLSMCILLETHLKHKNIQKVCENVFNNWKWHSNVKNSPNSCRIIVGWNDSKVNVMIIKCTSHLIFYMVEVISTKEKFYCSFVYAHNKGKDRITLWEELAFQSRIANKTAWFIMGNFNVTRYLHEYSSGSSLFTDDMNEFNDCINKLHLEDINSTGFHFTWTKSLKNPRCGNYEKI